MSLLKGTYMDIVAGDTDVKKLVQASAALPPYFPFVEMANDLVVNGGFRNITPLSSAFKAASPPDEVYVLLTRQIASSDGKLLSCTIEEQPLGPWKSLERDPRKLYERVAERLVEVLMDEVYIEDIKRAIQVNMLARALEETAPGTRVSQRPSSARGGDRPPPRYVKLHGLAPRRRFNPAAEAGHGDDIDSFDPMLIRDAIEHGAQVARDRTLWAWRPELERRFAEFF